MKSNDYRSERLQGREQNESPQAFQKFPAESQVAH